MNLSNTTLTLQQLERPSNFSIIKRLLNLGLVIIGVVICVHLWLAHTEQAETWYQKQANQLGRSLGKLAAQTLVTPLQKEDSHDIAQHLDYLASDPYVTGVALYNQKGQLIEELDTNLTIIARYKVDPAIPLVFIQDIRNEENDIIGYLRIVLDESTVMQYHFDYQQQMLQQLEVLLVLAGIIGFIICRAFYTFRYRQYRQLLGSATNDND
ncbi:AhpA/YtjB family protein [Paraglaciecola sp.]|uniref:AhpA/YtjB family protein n=1 Tax=Paraglaciecola sp. TaxID=1920173 RepID=UPI0030F4AD83